MIIACPKCSAGFFVNPQQIGTNGRRVKCSKCQHVWNATIPLHSAAKETHEHHFAVAERVHKPIPAGSNLPAIIPVRVNPVLYAMPGIFALLIAITVWILYPTVTDALGVCGDMCIDRNLTLSNVDYQYDRISGVITVDYRVKNNATYDISLPKIRVNLHNDKDSIIATSFYNESIKISPKQISQNIRTVFREIDDKKAIKTASIALGSSSIFLIR